MDDLFGWDRCDHSGIGKPGCATCDPKPVHVRERLRVVEERLRQAQAERDAAVADRDDWRDEMVQARMRVRAVVGEHLRAWKVQAEGNTALVGVAAARLVGSEAALRALLSEAPTPTTDAEEI